MNYIVLLIALAVASVAAYFSIFGIGLIFAGAFWPAVVMGIALEGAKIVAVSWLYRHWDIAHWTLKSYLIGSVVILSLITSMGIFGFLSRAHIQQSAALNTGAASQIELIDDQISQQKNVIAEIDTRQKLIVNAQQKMIDSGRAGTALSAGEDQRRAVKALNDERNKATEALNELTTKKIKLTNDVRTAEVEVGPIRYIAEFFFDKSDTGTLERAVRWMIIVIIFVFDPLSIALFIAYNTVAVQKDPNKIMSLTEDFVGRKYPGLSMDEPRPKQVLTVNGNSDTITINKNNIKEMK
jgi:hypothetical protein